MTKFSPPTAEGELGVRLEDVALVVGLELARVLRIVRGGEVFGEGGVGVEEGREWRVRWLVKGGRGEEPSTGETKRVGDGMVSWC